MRRALMSLTAISFLASFPARAQLVSAGLGPAFPAGEFNSELEAGTSLFLSGRVNLSLLVFQLQFELAHTSWGVTETAGDADLEIWQPAVNLAFRFIRVGPVRPYVLAGVVGSNQKIATPTSEESDVRFGWQAGAGVDFKLGPLKPFVEFRVVNLDGPGDVSVKYSPLLFGIGIF